MKGRCSQFPSERETEWDRLLKLLPVTESRYWYYPVLQGSMSTTTAVRERTVLGSGEPAERTETQSGVPSWIIQRERRDGKPNSLWGLCQCGYWVVIAGDGRSGSGVPTNHCVTFHDAREADTFAARLSTGIPTRLEKPSILGGLALIALQVIDVVIGVCD